MTTIIVVSGVVFIVFIVLPIIRDRVSDSRGWWVLEKDVEIDVKSGLLTVKNVPCEVFDKPGSDIIISKLDKYGTYKIISTVKRNNLRYYRVAEPESEEKKQKPEELLKIFQGIGFPPAR